MVMLAVRVIGGRGHISGRADGRIIVLALDQWRRGLKRLQ